MGIHHVYCSKALLLWNGVWCWGHLPLLEGIRLWHWVHLHPLQCMSMSGQKHEGCYRLCPFNRFEPWHSRLALVCSKNSFSYPNVIRKRLTKANDHHHHHRYQQNVQLYVHLVCDCSSAPGLLYVLYTWAVVYVPVLLIPCVEHDLSMQGDNNLLSGLWCWPEEDR